MNAFGIVANYTINKRILFMKILIIGANGFIGSHLSAAILQKTDWTIHALDLASHRLTACLEHSRFHFLLGDMTKQMDWIAETMRQVDVVLPLAAIATPATYVNDPLRVFELDFEANLAIIRLCAKLNKRLVFPSTSEVYGKCTDAEFDEESSDLVTGPIHKERWIYAASKQLLDRIIYAYGKQQNMLYTLFRPFNWYGPGLDDIHNAKPGSSRVLTQFIGHALRGESIQLVNGGLQQRCFTYIDDGVSALLKIIENQQQVALQKIYNIGNPSENISIKHLAEKIVRHIAQIPQYADCAERVRLVSTSADNYYGSGYEDIINRVPAIERAKNDLQWQPIVGLDEGLKKVIASYLEQSAFSAITES